MWGDMIVSLVVYRSKGSKVSLLYKENQPRFDLSKSSLIFFTNPHFVLLILIVWCCISSMRPHSSLITGAMRDAYILNPPPERLAHDAGQQKVRKKVVMNILIRIFF